LDAAHWFISINGEAKGPFTEDKVKELLSDSLIDEHSSVWSSDSVNDAWQPLFRSELSRLLSGRVVRPPPIPSAVSDKAKNTVDTEPPDLSGMTPISPSDTIISKTNDASYFILMLSILTQFIVTSIYIFGSLMVETAVENNGTAAALRIYERVDGVVAVWFGLTSFIIYALAQTWWIASETYTIEHSDTAAPSSRSPLPIWVVWFSILPVVGALIAVAFLRYIISQKINARKNLADTTFVIWALTSVLASVDGFFIFLYSLLGAEHPYYCLGRIDSGNIEYCNGIDNVQNMLVWFSVVSLFWIVFSVRRGIGYDPLFMWVLDKRR
jgi:hypothetical protein